MTHSFPPPAYSDEVRQALDAGKPVVALESTIITHGMPRPDNLEMAESVEAIIRDVGAVPATIAVIEGQLHIGLEPAALAGLAQTTEAMKVSRADLAFAIATGRTGATTVAATMIAAELAGITVFATGGIGGVHRGAEGSFDISTDLDELARTPVIVVCAGAKAILDIPKTLEVLETKGVPVVTVGSDTLPAFWSRDFRSRVSAAPRRSAWHRAVPPGSPPCRHGRRHAGGKPGAGGSRNPARGNGNPHYRRPGRSRCSWHRRQGGNAVPAGPHFRYHRGSEPHDQHRAGQAQRPPGCRNRPRPFIGRKGNSVVSGYSGTPLARKLSLKDGQRVVLASPCRKPFRRPSRRPNCV